jgi:nucleoside-diphosphate-sugar epimerase
MRKKILVLGGTGMLGHMVLKVLSKADDMEVRGTHLMNPADALYFDVLSGLQKLDEIFELQNGLDYFINCI